MKRPDSLFISQEEAIALLGCCKDSFERWRRQGYILPVARGLYSRKQIEEEAQEKIIEEARRKKHAKTSAKEGSGPEDGEKAIFIRRQPA
jgi:hypothetical protein